MLRLDHRFSNNTVAFVRYNQDIARIDSPTGSGVRNDHFKPQNLVAEVNHIFSPSVVNQLKVGWNHARLDRQESGAFYETITVPGFVTLTGNSQLLEDGKGQRPVIIEPPFEPLVAFDDSADRAFEIGRGLLDAVVEIALVEPRTHLGVHGAKISGAAGRVEQSLRTAPVEG